MCKNTPCFTIEVRSATAFWFFVAFHFGFLRTILIEIKLRTCKFKIFIKFRIGQFVPKWNKLDSLLLIFYGTFGAVLHKRFPQCEEHLSSL